MIPATKATDAHTQDSVVNGELLLPILKVFSLHISWLHTTLSAWYFQSVNIRTACRAYKSSLVVPPPRSQQPTYRGRQPPDGDHPMFCGLYYPRRRNLSQFWKLSVSQYKPCLNLFIRPLFTNVYWKQFETLNQGYINSRRQSPGRLYFTLR